MYEALITLLGFNPKNQSVAPTVEAATVRRSYVKTRKTNLNGFKHISHLSVAKQKRYHFETMRENVFYLAKKLVPGMHWTLAGPNPVDHSRLPRGNPLTRLPEAHGRNTLIAILAMSNDRIERQFRMKENGSGNAPSFTTNTYFVSKWAEFFTKELGFTVTVDDLLYPAVKSLLGSL